jgi:tetratricopeptide (TPR) repeat protein
MSCQRSLIALFWVVASVAHAEPSVEDKQHAGELAQESQAHYKRGEFEVSAALLRQAYALYPEPNLLYNLGRSLEGFGDKQGAVNAYKDYLATASQIEDRGAIERRVAMLQSELDKAKPVVVEKPPEPPPIVVQPPIAKPIEHHEDTGSIAPWITIGAGVLITGGGGVFGYEARKNHDSAVHALTGLAAQSYADTSHRDAVFADVGLIAGGAVLATGVIWALVTHRSHDHAEVSIRPHITSTSVAVEWTFF